MLNTFKAELDYWNIKPQLLNYKELDLKNKDIIEWTSSVHHLSIQKQIVHIVPNTEDASMINFIFFRDTSPFHTVGINKVARDGFDCADLVNDLRDPVTSDQNQFIAILFTKNDSTIPFTTVKFSRSLRKRKTVKV